MDELQKTIELRTKEGFSAALQVVLTDQGKAVKDLIRLKVNEINKEERSLLKQRSTNSRDTANITQFIVVYGILLCLLNSSS